MDLSPWQKKPTNHRLYPWQKKTNQP